MFVQLKELQFKKDILAFNNDILLHEMFIADKRTQAQMKHLIEIY